MKERIFISTIVVQLVQLVMMWEVNWMLIISPSIAYIKYYWMPHRIRKHTSNAWISHTLLDVWSGILLWLCVCVCEIVFLRVSVVSEAFKHTIFHHVWADVWMCKICEICSKSVNLSTNACKKHNKTLEKVNRTLSKVKRERGIVMNAVRDCVCEYVHYT